MHALTVQQPLAWAVFHGGQLVLNIQWRPAAWVITKRVLVYAGEPGHYCEAIEAEQWVEARSGRRAPPLPELPRGAIVGAVTVGRLIGPGASTGDAAIDCWHLPKQWGMVVENPVPLDPPMRCRGSAKLWTVVAEDAEKLKRRFEEKR